VDKVKLGEVLAQHPRLVALVFAGLVGWAGLQAFNAGVQYAGLRIAVSEHARVASEALGG